MLNDTAMRDNKNIERHSSSLSRFHQTRRGV